MFETNIFEEEPANSVFDAFTKAFRQYFKFKGRTCRYDYWGFIFVNTLVSFLFSIVSIFLLKADYLGTIWSILVLIPSISIFVRRLHDVGKSFLKNGILPIIVIIILVCVAINVDKSIAYLVGVAPTIIWAFYLLILTCLQGTSEANIYGKPIKEDEHQNCIAKWLIFFTIIVPLILKIGVFIIGTSNYNKAMINYENNKQQYNINDQDDTEVPEIEEDIPE